jgi:hypothetical protein
MCRVPQAAVFTDFPTMDGHSQHVALKRATLRVVYGFTATGAGRSNDMTYYRVEFLPAQPDLRPVKKFLTEEKAKKHARRVLGVAADGDLATRATIVAVSRDGTPV